jgi:putative transposase
MPKAFYRRQLPHLQRDSKPHFVTFCTYRRWILPERVRLAVLNCCLREDGASVELHVAVVMPDHVHMILTPLVDDEALEVYSLAGIMNAIKGASAHKINLELGRTGHVWQTESFDHVLRSSESLDQQNSVCFAESGSGRTWGRLSVAMAQATAKSVCSPITVNKSHIELNFRILLMNCGALLRRTAEGGCPHVALANFLFIDQRSRGVHHRRHLRHPRSASS